MAGCVAPDFDRLAVPRVGPVGLPHLDLTDAHDHKDRASHAVAWNVGLLGDPAPPI